ncbi:hypothetical protein DCAR_0934060 [Daucus carota subsp. sativus]|uniref:Uncharacterized protein n=1 Tax=Daucus carota subsp. sativus TaxID=79200 RepID=A0AAF1BHD3_DAUCS|nr:hypothetical protein DCAR_0934060 [Daucus carota subsp. sativus]
MCSRNDIIRKLVGYQYVVFLSRAMAWQQLVHSNRIMGSFL